MRMPTLPSSRTVCRLGAALLLVVVAAAGCAQPASEPVALESESDKTLYAMGQMMGQRVAPFGFTEEEAKMVARGLEDAAANRPSSVDLQAYGPKVQALAQERMQKSQGKQNEALAKSAEAEKAKAQEFLGRMEKEAGAQKTESGLVFIPMKEGSGASPAATDVVKVHYHGTLADGTVFDSSVQRGEPAEFPLNGVVKCWTEGVQKLKVGGKAKLVCPSAIAYGDRGFPPKIPGGAALAFEVELLEIKKK